MGNFVGVLITCFWKCSALFLTLERESAVGYLLLPWGSTVELPVVHPGSYILSLCVQRLLQWLKLACMMSDVDSYTKVRAGGRQKESISKLNRKYAVQSYSPESFCYLWNFQAVFSLLISEQQHSGWWYLLRIIWYICVQLKLQLLGSFENYCILLPISNLHEFIHLLYICIYRDRWLLVLFCFSPRCV